MFYTAGLSVLSAALGYYTGSSRRNHMTSAAQASDDLETELIDPEELPDGDLSAVHAGFFEPCKLVSFDAHPTYSINNFDKVLVVRTDLKLGSGDISTQFVLSLGSSVHHSYEFCRCA